MLFTVIQSELSTTNNNKNIEIDKSIKWLFSDKINVNKIDVEKQS